MFPENPAVEPPGFVWISNVPRAGFSTESFDADVGPMFRPRDAGAKVDSASVFEKISAATMTATPMATEPESARLNFNPGRSTVDSFS